MPVNPVEVKKLALEKNTTDLRQMLEQSDELMRAVMEKGDLETAEKAAEEAAQAAAALIVRKQGGVRELASVSANVSRLMTTPKKKFLPQRPGDEVATSSARP